MTFACHYTIVRFAPFAETGEFANVGIVLYSPTARFFSFQLMKNRYARITNFFEELDAKVYRSVMRHAQDELQRVAQRFKPLGVDKRFKSFDNAAANTLWAELTKPLASVLRMSEPRIVMAGDPSAKLKELFGYYVERNFVTREYQDEILIRAVRGALRDAGVNDRFHPMRVGNDEYHATFPLVATTDEDPVQIIKPLNLSQAEPTKILDHGFAWIHRIKTLRRKHLLPRDVLVAVDDQQPNATERQRAAKQEVLAELAQLDVQVEEIRNTSAVRLFAARVLEIPAHRHITVDKFQVTSLLWGPDGGVSPQKHSVTSPESSTTFLLPAPENRSKK